MTRTGIGSGPGFSFIAFIAFVAVIDIADGQTLIRQHEGPATGGAFGTAVAMLQDLDGDGVRDYAISDCGVDEYGLAYHAGTVDVFSGATGATLFTIQGSGSGTFGLSLGDAGDVDGDGISDLLVGDPLCDDPKHQARAGTVRTYSGEDGALIHENFGAWADAEFGGFVGGLDDADGDGVPDFLVSTKIGPTGNDPVHLLGISGSDGSKLYEVDLDLSGSWNELAAVGVDRDGDGLRDFVMLGDAQGNIVRAGSGATGATIFEFDLGASEQGRSITETSDIDGDGQPEVLVEDLYLWGTDSSPVIDVVSLAKSVILRIEGRSVVGVLPDLDGDGVGEHLLFEEGRSFNFLALVSGRSGQPMIGNLPGMPDGHDPKISTVGDLDADGVADLVLSNSAFIDPVSGLHRGIVQLYSNDEFWIEADPNPAGSGVVETLTAGRVPSGNLIGIAMLDVSGTPLFQFLALAPADSNDALILSDVVPPGLAGLTMTFQAFAIGRTGRLVDSGIEAIDFL